MDRPGRQPLSGNRRRAILNQQRLEPPHLGAHIRRLQQPERTSGTTLAPKQAPQLALDVAKRGLEAAGYRDNDDEQPESVIAEFREFIDTVTPDDFEES